MCLKVPGKRKFKMLFVKNKTSVIAFFRPGQANLKSTDDQCSEDNPILCNIEPL